MNEPAKIPEHPSTSATTNPYVGILAVFLGAGLAAMNRVLSVRERFHSNILVQMNEWLTDKRVHTLTAGMLPHSSGPEGAQSRAVAILSQQVRAQAYTLATSDGFILITWVAIFYLLLMLFLRPGKISFKDLKKMP